MLGDGSSGGSSNHGHLARTAAMTKRRYTPLGSIAACLVILLSGCERKWIRVAPDFRYTGSHRTVVLPEERAAALEGVVVDRNNENVPIPLALVEVVSDPNTQKRITAVLTDATGRYQIRRSPSHYWLKVSYRYMVTVLVPVVVAPDAARKTVTISLHVE